MFIRIPFEKEIDFKTNISEITKMSLEHDYNVNDNNILGNFYISGEYKSHEVCINTEEFHYTLPFEVELNSNFDRNSLEFNIEDFSYDIKDHQILKVNIEYSIKAEEKTRKETNFLKVNDDELKDELAYIDNFLDKGKLREDSLENDSKTLEEDQKGEKKMEEEIKEKIEENVKDKEMVTEIEETQEIVEEKKEERVLESEEKTMLDTVQNSDDTFVTYHIHIVLENETLESICNKYGVPSSLVEEYNKIDSISIGDKILIPKVDE